jgi:hypothetical protein
MNPAAELLSELLTRGVVVSPAGASLDLYPRSALSPDLLARVRALKPQLLELLRAGAGAVASPAEWIVLTILALHPGLAPDELAAATHLDQPPLAKAIHTLLRRGEIAADLRGRLRLRIV